METQLQFGSPFVVLNNVEPEDVRVYNSIILSKQLPVVSRYISPAKGKGLFSQVPFLEGKNQFSL